MSLIPVDAEYHYVQDTAPSSANAGDVWLDTSVNPPVAKIYADVGNGLEWIQDQLSDRIATNLDAKVSSVGGGVDWASKTPDNQWDRTSQTYALAGNSTNTTYSLSGSGILTGFSLSQMTTSGGSGDTFIKFFVDGSKYLDWDLDGADGFSSSGALLWGFDSSITIDLENTNDFENNLEYQLVISYVLD